MSNADTRDHLPYAADLHHRAPNPDRLFHQTVIIAGLPILPAVFMLLLQWITRSKVIVDIGLAIVPACLIGFLLGTVFLVTFIRTARSAHDRTRLVRRILILATLVLINLPLAAALASAVVRQHQRYTLTVINASQTPIQTLIITAPQTTFDMGPVLPYSNVSRSFPIPSPGPIHFTAERETAIFTGAITPSALPHQRAHLTLTIESDGQWRVVAE